MTPFAIACVAVSAWLAPAIIIAVAHDLIDDRRRLTPERVRSALRFGLSWPVLAVRIGIDMAMCAKRARAAR